MVLYKMLQNNYTFDHKKMKHLENTGLSNVYAANLKDEVVYDAENKASYSLMKVIVLLYIGCYNC